MKTPLLSFLGIAALAFTLTAAPAARAQATLSTEDFLNRLGVNTHLNGLTKDDPWNTDEAQVATQLKYIGVRLDRDWAWSVADGRKWKAVQTAWGPYGRFWTSIDEASPANQRKDLGFEEAIQQDFPGLIYAMGGPNEEDNTYPQSQGATLPDSALVQQSLYAWAHSGGRSVPVSQMEFGAGWTASNDWQGDYNPANTGLHQPYTPGHADFAGAHTYLSDPTQKPIDVLNGLRARAHLTTPGKPVAHTEFGAYTQAGLSTHVFGQFLVMGALDSAAGGDAAYLVYGLQDSAPEHSYGFFTYPGGKPHEAADYFRTMTTLLKSGSGGYGPGAPHAFIPKPLGKSFSDPMVSHLLMQKPTGEFVVAAWSEQLMNGTEHAASDTIGFGRSFATVRVYDIEDGLTPIAVLHHVSRYALAMKPSDTYLLVLSDGDGARPYKSKSFPRGRTPMLR